MEVSDPFIEVLDDKIDGKVHETIKVKIDELTTPTFEETPVDTDTDSSKDTDVGIVSVSQLSLFFIFHFVIYFCSESIQLCLNTGPMLVSSLPSSFSEPFLGSSGFGGEFSSSSFVILGVKIGFKSGDNSRQC